MDGWEFFNWLATVGFITCLIPQLLRTLRTRRADDISRRFLVVVILSSASMLVYMLHVGNYVFAFAQAVNIVVWGIVLAIQSGMGARPAPKVQA